MKILLGNTGRGGEQCVFSAFVQAYKDHFPSAHITVAVCPEFVRFWHSDNSISIIPLEHESPDKPYYMDPYGKWVDVASTPGYDIVEFVCEYGLNPAATQNESKPVTANIWNRLRTKPCQLDDLIKKVSLVPSDEELRIAEDIRSQYGDDLLVISPKSNSACPVIPLEWYSEIARQLGKYCPIATTGRTWGMPVPDPLLTDTIDLRGKSLLSLYAMSSWLRRFIGPDTATCWIVSKMPGELMVLRGDEAYPITNTGLINNDFRHSYNTIEYNVNTLTLDTIIETCTTFFID